MKSRTGAESPDPVPVTQKTPRSVRWAGAREENKSRDETAGEVTDASCHEALRLVECVFSPGGGAGGAV